jgi:hypothetical protein
LSLTDAWGKTMHVTREALRYLTWGSTASQRSL